MHKHTFGTERGSEILIDILDKGPVYQKKHMNSFLQKYISELEQLQFVKNYRVKMWWLERIYQYYKNKLINDNIVDQKVKDFGNNVIVSLYRTKIRLWELRGKNWYKRREYQIKNA